MNNQPIQPQPVQHGLAVQVQVVTALLALREGLVSRLDGWRDDDEGEVTATTALIVLLVGAAIAAGVIIAGKITNNANNIPEPG